MLSELFAAFPSVIIPDNTTVSFVVVDNDKDGSVRPLCEEFRRTVDRHDVFYVFEPRQGIPIARNQALEQASEIGADLGAFIDDDETPDPTWLSELVATLRLRDLQLLGGPVRPVLWREHDDITLWQRLIFRGTQWRLRRKERRSARKTRAGTDDEIVVVTNNWIIDMHWWRKAALMFDESLRFGGGSDALFFDRAKKNGIKSGWCPTAIVYESVPGTRLSFRYQFNRARNQAISSFHRKYGNRPAGTLVLTLTSCGLKAISMGLVLIAIVFAPGAAIVQIARTSGWILGRLQALSGAKSSLYRTTDGM